MNDNLAEVLEKLEPCPWCGGHAVVDISSGSDERNGYNFSVAIVCVPCSAKLTRASGYDKNGWCNESVASVTARAITAWNTRPALLRDAGDGWRSIESAPDGQLVVVCWRDEEDAEHPDRYEFDYLEDGVWQKHSDDYEHFCAVAPAGSRGPSEQAPYTGWRRLPPAMHAPGGVD